MFQAVRNGDFHAQSRTLFKSNSLFNIASPISFTSLCIQVREGSSIDGAYILVNGETIALTRDDHVPSNGEWINSNLISFPGPANSFDLFSGEIQGEVRLHFIHGGSGTAHLRHPTPHIDSDCTEAPTSIQQVDWRSGLQDPNFTRSFSQVEHVIIHHSAGSNTNTNYTQVVRDIYIYHTQVNGWSDIGYNYLIAQDGSIYAGRDPGSGAQDDVRGAHFCGMNTGTMGVCLLGTYTDTEPSDQALTSLIALTTWKLNKEGLNPHDAFPFRALPALGAVSGHRDGCATECPGEKVYQRISSLKQTMNVMLDDCDPGASLTAEFQADKDSVEAGGQMSFSDLSVGNIDTWQWDFEGATPASSNARHPNNILYQNSGSYDVRLIVRSGARIDTLLKENIVRVFEAPSATRLFPNPARQGETLHVQIAEPGVRRVMVIGMAGQQLDFNWYPGLALTIDSGQLQKGMYILKIFRDGGNESIRFAVM